MIKARLNKPDGNVVLLLGLEAENMARLMADEPIRIGYDTLEDVLGDDVLSGLRSFEIIIIGGADQDALEQQLRPWFGPDTVVHRS